MKKRGVGIVVFFWEDKCLKALLQRRGLVNTEKGSKETYPGCYQVTCHGGLENYEDFREALVRESREELGEEFTKHIVEIISTAVLVKTDTDKKEAITYGLVIDSIDPIRTIRLGPDTGGLDWITKEEALQLVPITDDMKINGPPPGIRAAFQDEIDAILAGFELFG